MLLPHAQLKILCIAALLPVMLVSLPLDYHGVYSAELSLSDAEKYRKVMAMYRHYRKNFPEIGEIDAVAAIALLGDSGVVFVDVREPEEQAVSMIPGAMRSDAFLEHLDNFAAKRVIVYCTISYRSGKLAAKLARKGVTVINLKGGLLRWVHAGGPLIRSGKAVRQLHVYGRKWDLAPANIETVY